MKNIWNILLISSATIVIALYFMLEYFAKNKIETIKYDGTLDKNQLNICDEDRILQYYMVSTDYNGGKRAIKNKLLPIIEEEGISFGTENGNITIRFIVNCKGEIGLFRAKSINENLKSTDFDDANLEFLKSLVSQLDDWIVKSENEMKFDSYYHINFKIRNGLVTDIF